MEIKTVEFRGAALGKAPRPREWVPHVAVAGRSNVGKSSLLNWLFRRRLAHVAKAPGKTRTLNYYLVNGSFYLVDLPGYGYASVGRELRQQWGRELSAYLAREERLAGVLCLVDVRHGLTALDRELQALLDQAGRRRMVVLTKADKVGRGAREAMRRTVQRELGLATPPPAVSVKTGDGRRELLKGMEWLIETWREQRRGAEHGTQEEERQR